MFKNKVFKNTLTILLISCRLLIETGATELESKYSDVLERMKKDPAKEFEAMNSLIDKYKMAVESDEEKANQIITLINENEELKKHMVTFYRPQTESKVLNSEEIKNLDFKEVIQKANEEVIKLKTDYEKTLEYTRKLLARMDYLEGKSGKLLEGNKK